MQLRERRLICQLLWNPPHPNPLPGGERAFLLAVTFGITAPCLLPSSSSTTAPPPICCPVSGTRWRVVSDTVMGGVSQGRLSVAAVLGRPCWCLQGEVSLANNGGFVQASLDLSVAGFLDAGAYRGIELDACGNGGRYNVPLRTADTRTPRMQFYDCENGRREFTCGIALTYPLPKVHTRSIGVASDRVASSVVESR